MLSPGNRIVLLPQDREIMDLTGMSEAEYRWFVRECQKNAKIRPGDPVALEPITLALINLAIGILLTVAGALLTPKPKDQERKTPEEETIEGQNVVRRDRFAPKSGFDSFQNVVEMGSIVPIIYCKREGIYGGLRVNTNLLWSQILSIGGGQFFKGLFLVGEAGVKLDNSQIALGNNTLASYELTQDAEAGRVTVYYNRNGGRIDESDYKLGVIPANDPGAITGEPGDVYAVDGETDFCQAIQPSNQVEFGVYGHIGNNFGYKLGERFVAITQWQNRSDGKWERQNSNQKLAEMKKYAMKFTTRAGFVGTTRLRTVAAGDTLNYVIYSSSEYDRTFEENGSSSGGEQPSVVNNHDVATAIASIQREFDERISIGALYRCGSAIAVCTNRSDPFVSEVEYDSGGTTMTATFEVIEGGDGQVHEWSNADLEYTGGNEYDYTKGRICSEHSQIFQLLVGAFSVERACSKIEVGLQSNVGLRSSGITNFNSLVTEEDYDSGYSRVPNNSYQAYIDAEFCGGQEDGVREDEAYRKEILPGTYSGADTRYSFFRILFRNVDEANFRASNNLYGVRSSTSVDTYNFLRFEFGEDKRREFRFMPVSSWEIRSGIATGLLYAIDAHARERELTVNENGYSLQFIGVRVDRSAASFEVKAFTSSNNDNIQLGLSPYDDVANTSYVDGWARIAEAFIYDGVSTTASEPEHRISYVNIIDENDATPEYDDLAIFGLNIRSSKELRNLDQLSVYCVRGVIDSHLFPDIFEDLLTNDRYGTGEFFDPAQIEDTSFANSAAWTNSRNYYFDGAITEKINLRTWGAERARDFLLDLSVSGGKFTLNPVLDFDNPMPIAGMFSSGNIIEDTLQVNYFDTQDRLDPIVSVRWREERQISEGTNVRGMFPVIREFTVRRAGVSENAPVIQVDLSGFCTNRFHATDRAKLECQSKRYITHAVSFKTTPSQTGVQAGSIIKLGIETVTYDQPQNGVITANGEVTSWPPLGDGTHNVLLWDGNTLSTRSLTITNGKAVGVTSAVFSLESGTTKADTYKVSSVSFDEDGNVEIEALYWPSAPDGKSLMTVDWDVAGEWEISG